MRSRASAWLWHIAMLANIAAAAIILPPELALCVTAATGLGWGAGSSIPYRDDPHGR